VLIDLGLARFCCDEDDDASSPAGSRALAQAGGCSTMRRVRTPAYSAIGSPAFMAPEQVRDARACTTAADVYGLGATWYAAVTGVLPFDGTSAAKVMQQVLDGECVPPSVRVPELPRAVERTLSESSKHPHCVVRPVAVRVHPREEGLERRAPALSHHFAAELCARVRVLCGCVRGAVTMLWLLDKAPRCRPPCGSELIDMLCALLQTPTDCERVLAARRALRRKRSREDLFTWCLRAASCMAMAVLVAWLAMETMKLAPQADDVHDHAALAWEKRSAAPSSPLRPPS
jgi:serine/threonine protein kinase